MSKRTEGFDWGNTPKHLVEFHEYLGRFAEEHGMPSLILELAHILSQLADNIDKEKSVVSFDLGGDRAIMAIRSPAGVDSKVIAEELAHLISAIAAGNVSLPTSGCHGCDSCSSCKEPVH